MNDVLNRIATLLAWVCLGLCVWTLLVDNQAIATKTSLAALIVALVTLIIRPRE